MIFKASSLESGPDMFTILLQSLLIAARARIDASRAPERADPRAADVYFWRGRHWQPPEA